MAGQNVRGARTMVVNMLAKARSAATQSNRRTGWSAGNRAWIVATAASYVRWRGARRYVGRGRRSEQRYGTTVAMSRGLDRLRPARHRLGRRWRGHLTVTKSGHTEGSPSTPWGGSSNDAQRGGFTLVEVLIAVIVLGIGVTALVGSSALVTRMVGRGKSETLGRRGGQPAAGVAAVLAYSTARAAPRAGSPAAGPVHHQRHPRALDRERRGQDRHRVRHGHPSGGREGTHTDVLTTQIEC